MPDEDVRRHSAARYAGAALFVIGAASTGLLLWIVATARLFRPVQDDYVFAEAGLRLGPLRGAWEYFLTLNGGLTQSLYDYAIGAVVGMLPWRWAYVPFTVGFVVLVVLVCGQMLAFLLPALSRRYRYALAPTAAAVVFLSFGVLSSPEGQDSLYTQFAWFAGANRGVFSWVLLSLILVWLRRGRILPERLWPLSALIGLVLGFWNMPEAVFVIALCALGVAERRWRGRTGSIRELLALAGGAAVAGAVNYLSPGSVNRQGLLGETTIDQKLEGALESLENLWAMTVGSFGLVFVASIGLALGVLVSMVLRERPLPREAWTKSAVAARRLLVVLTLLILIEVIVVAAAAGASYFAPHHSFGIAHLLHAAVLILFGSLGARLGLRFAAHTSWLLVGACVLAASVLVAEVQIMLHLESIARWRLGVWNTGWPAQFGYFIDRLPDSWITEGWEALRRARDLRGLD